MRRLAIAIAVLCVAPSARADTNEEEAKREFEAGEASEQAGRSDEACQHFRRALEKLRVSGPLDRAAKCDAKEGHFVEAVRKEDELLATLPADHPDRGGYEASRSQWRTKIAHLTLALRPGSGNVTLAVDGAPAKLDSPLDVDPGSHEVRVDEAGSPPVAKQIDLAPGADLRLDVPFEAGSTGHKRKEVPKGPSPWMIAGATNLALGGVAAIVAGVTGGLILDHKSKADELCPGDPEATACLEQIDAGEGLFTVNTAMWIAGGIFIAAGATFLIVDRVTAPAAASVALVVRPAGLSIIATF